jgi:hypothetical protein
MRSFLAAVVTGLMLAALHAIACAEPGVCLLKFGGVGFLGYWLVLLLMVKKDKRAEGRR